MAYYQNSNWVKHAAGTIFDSIHKPGEKPVVSGIYRCIGCGHEVVAESSREFPPQNHHQHTKEQGDIQWQLAVSTKIDLSIE